MTLARFEQDFTDSAGALLAGSVSVEVRLEADGTLPQLYSDRAGSTGIGNPATFADGKAAFHVVGGSYHITVTQGAYSRELRYRAIGLAQETDFDGSWDSVSDKPAVIVGSTGSADNKLLRSNGTGGETLQESAIAVDDDGHITAFGGRIAFPATAVPSTDVNTLDDYEEGTWTPTLQFGGGNTGITYSQNTGSYTKIGQLVVARFNIQLTNKGSSTGGAAIAGLPFTPVTGLGGWLMSASGMSSWAATYFDPQGTPIANINLVTTSGTTQASNSNFGNSSALFGVIMFTAA